MRPWSHLHETGWPEKREVRTAPRAARYVSECGLGAWVADTQLAAESEDSVEPSEETTDDGTDAEEQAEKQSETPQNEAETLDAAAIDELFETEPETETKKSEENAA